MKSLVAVERTGNWIGHLQSVQDLLPLFRECHSLNYLWYGFLYLEKIKMLETEYPDIHKEFKKGHFAVQDYGGCFTAT